MSEEVTPKQSSGLAIAGLVLGIIAAVTSFLPIINNLSAMMAVVGGILAAVALVGALRGKHAAKGLSIAGVVLAVVSFAVVLATQSAYKAALDKAVDNMKSADKPVATSSASSDEQTEEASATTEQATKSETSEKSGDSKSKDEEPAPEEKDFSSLAVGETATFANGLSVTVNSVQTDLVNYDDTPVTCINVTYANNGSKSSSFNTYDWKGEDADGAQRSVTYYSDSTDELHSGTLKAGGTTTGNLYFEDGTVRVLYFSNMFADEASAGWVVR